MPLATSAVDELEEHNRRFAARVSSHDWHVLCI